MKPLKLDCLFCPLFLRLFVDSQLTNLVGFDALISLVYRTPLQKVVLKRPMNLSMYFNYNGQSITMYVCPL